MLERNTIIRCLAKTFTMMSCRCDHHRRARRFDHRRHAGLQSPVEAPPDGAGNVESQYAYWLMQAHPDWRVLNRGVNGERSDEIRARFARDVVDARAGRRRHHRRRQRRLSGPQRRRRCERELAAIYAAARAAKIPVVAGSIIPYNTATPEQNARMHAVNDWIRELRGAPRREHGVLRHAGGGRRAGRARSPGVLSRRPASVSRGIQTDGRGAGAGDCRPRSRRHGRCDKLDP